MNIKDHIRKRGKYWRLEFYPKDKNGQPILENGKPKRDQRSLKCKDRNEALKLASEIIREYSIKTELEITSEQSLTISKLNAHYINTRPTDSKNTLRAYGDYAECIEKFFGPDLLVIEIDAAMANKYKQHLVKIGNNRGSQHHKLAFLKRVLKWAHSDGKLSQFKLNNYQVPKPGDPRKGFYSKEEFEKLLMLLRKPFYAAGIIGGHTGMRVNEMSHFRYRWIDFESKVIHLPGEETYNGNFFKAKNGSGRSIPMPDRLYAYLKQKYASVADRDFYVISDRDRPYRNDSISAAIRRVARKIGKTEGSVHMLRHSYASWFLESEPTQHLTLMRICGWSDVRIAERYMHETNNYKEQKLQMVNAVFSKPVDVT